MKFMDNTNSALAGKIRLLLMAVVSGFIFACQPVERPEQLTIKIIETSDVHGAFFPYDLIEDQPTGHSLAHVSSYVNQERQNPDQVTILLDNGDILQGDPAVYYSNFEKTSGTHIAAEMMNFMEYDAATVGNHDIEAGHQVYDKLAGEFDFPWLAANAVRTSSGQPYFQPYTIIDVKGVKIAVLGLITPAIPKWLPPQIWEGMEFMDMIESAEYWVDYLKRNEKPDLLIGLFHAGIDHSYGGQTAETPLNENASKLVAEQVPGFDVVFVGHDHQGWNEKITNWAGQPVQILGPTSRARDVAVAEITLELNKTTNHYQKQIRGSIVNMETFAPDEAFMEKFGSYFEEVEDYVSKPISVLETDIYTRNALFGDAAFTDLIHQAQLEISDAQISFAAPLSFDKVIEAGPIEVRDMFKLYRYENLLYTMKLGGQEIHDFLEYSAALWFNTMNESGDHLLKFEENAAATGPRLENPYYNFDSAEGIIYTVDVSRPAGERVEIVSMPDGSPFDVNATYKVAVNSYRGNGGGGHLTAGAKIRSELLSERIIESTEKDLRFYLMKWIAEKGNLNPQVNFNWQILPENWYPDARKRDRELLFGAP